MNDLRRRREQLGLSLADVAARTGRSHSAIGRIERGERSPTLETLALICRALEIAVIVNHDRRGGTTIVRYRPARN